MREKSLTGMTVSVTAEDIRRGKPRFANLCPIARAIKRATKANFLLVAGRRLRVYGKNQHTTSTGYALPIRAEIFQLNFDTGEPVTPITFRIGRKDQDETSSR